MTRLRLLLGGALLLACPAAAVDTQYWISSSSQDYARAEARGAVVLADGSVTLGHEVEEATSDSTSVYWSAAVLSDGSAALASGQQGRIDRWVPGKGIRPWVRLGSGQVFCLVRDGDGLLAGTGPRGLVYRVSPRGDTTLVASTGESYVWALAPARKGWYAATGPRGKLLLLEGGRARTVFDSDESNLVSLISDGTGGAYAGGDTHGRVLHLRADGAVRTVFDATENEVRALARGSGGVLYAAALSAAAAVEDESEQEPKPVKTTTGRSTVYRIVPDSVVAQHWVAPQSTVFGLAVRDGRTPQLLVAAGNRAALYRVDQPAAGALLFAPKAGQLTSITLDAQGDAFVTGSNPGSIYRVSAGPAAKGWLTSAVLDARRYARFGRIRWRGEANGGRVRLTTRSGNCETPDSTWSPWTGGDEASFRVASPPARYLQWKIALERGGAGGPHVEAVEVAYREQNLPPRLEELVVAPQAVGFREGELLPRTEPVTQNLPGGQKVEYSIRTKEGGTLRSLPEWARGLRTLQWKASDPNGDDLRFKIEYHREGEQGWHLVEGELAAPSYTWDTNSLPDGRYRVRVVASDAPDNPVEEAAQATLESVPVTVDNTPPSVVELAASPAGPTVRVSGRARDATSILSRLELSVDGTEWRALRPEGGLADHNDLGFDTTLEGLSPGEHSVSVRAVDGAGNTGIRTTSLRLPRR